MNNQARISQLFEDIKQQKIIILGDLMLDRYLWGKVARISPEAPVPVVEIESEFSRLGGAANVAYNVASMGATPLTIGVIGADAAGEEVRNQYRKLNFSAAGLIVDASRCTTEKTRIIAQDQHVVRTDREIKTEISDEILEQILVNFKGQLPQASAVILQDYNKGLITQKLLQQVIPLINEQGKIVVVDPKFNHFFDYKNVTLIKPNKKEAEQVLGMKIQSRADIIHAGEKIKEKLQCRNVLITLSEQGMSLFDENGQVEFIPTTARKVHDVSGAGDTVISVLSVALAAGADVRQASILANFAAGIVCEEVGVVPIKPDALYQVVVAAEGI